MAFSIVFMPPQDNETKALARELSRSELDVVVHLPSDVSRARSLISESEAAFGTIPPEVLENAEKLKWLQAPQAGPPAGYFYQELIDHPVIVSNFRGIFSSVIPAHALGMILFFARGFHLYIRQQRAGVWRRLDDSYHCHLPDSTVLVVGVGGIGAEVARLCSELGMRVIGVDARHARLKEPDLPLDPPERLDELLPEADFVVVTVPHTPQTDGLFEKSKFAAMKSSAFFINVGRGQTTKLDDLGNALAAAEIAGAGLDVFEVEPLPRDHQLWTEPNVLITPHSATAGLDLAPLRAELFMENARRFDKGEPLLNVVDKAKWF